MPIKNSLNIVCPVCKKEVAVKYEGNIVDNILICFHKGKEHECLDFGEYYANKKEII